MSANAAPLVACVLLLLLPAVVHECVGPASRSVSKVVAVESLPAKARANFDRVAAATRGTARRIGALAIPEPSRLRARDVRLALFDDVELTARTQSAKDGEAGEPWSWVAATGEGPVPGRAAVASVFGNALWGRLESPRGIFHLVPLGGGFAAVFEADPGKARADHPARSAKPNPPSRVRADELAQCTAATPTTAKVRVAVAYSRAAALALPDYVPEQVEWGPIPPEDATVAHFASYLVTLTNTALAESGAATRLVLAGSRKFGAWDSTYSDLEPFLDDLIGGDPGKFTDLRAWRRARSANVVAVLTTLEAYRDTTAGGLSPAPDQLGGSQHAERAYSLVVFGPADANLSFAHELGHQFKASHDAGTGESFAGAPGYARGYVKTGVMRSIMAYREADEPRLLMYSNCYTLVNDLRFGNESKNNARAIDNAAATVAALVAP